MKNLKEGHVDQKENRSLTIIIEGKKFEWGDQYITGLQLKELRGLPSETELYLDIDEPWKDDFI